MSENPEIKNGRRRLAGWLMIAAGGLSLATHFNTDNPGAALAAMAFFASALFLFQSAKKI